MKRLQLFPDTTRIENDSLIVGECDLNTLANEFGTPLYLYDRATLESAVGTYRRALEYSYPGQGFLTYAGKAFLCLAMAEWTQQSGLCVDCTGLGEISIAVAGGVKREHILVHGVNKTAQDLEAAIAHAGVIVVDNLVELKHLLQLARPGSFPDLWLRFQPGVAVETHAYIQTGIQDSKFGMVAEEIVQAANFCRENRLPIKGLHFHLGSQFRAPEPLGVAIDKVLDLARDIGLKQSWSLSPGGGWGVAYHEDDLPQPDVGNYIRFIAEAVKEGCQARQLSLPRLHLEPGRSLVARAGVALYRVGVIRQTEHRIWVLLDGGLADNPRRALYGARYSALPVRQPDRPNVAPVWMAGPYCESSDVLIEALPFPEVWEGDLIAVPVSGAYQLSMSSNYNGARRPAVIWLEGGRAKLIQRRETPEDLYRRDGILVK
jgi:diaminopimelate decarboxylase